MKKVFVFLVVFVFLCPFLNAQESLKSIEEEYYDSLSLSGKASRPAIGYRTLSDSVWFVDEDTEHPWKENNLGTTFTLFESANPASNLFFDGINQSLKLRIYGPSWFNSYNSTIPHGQNDGVLWQSAGYNTSLSAGIRLEGFGFEATIKPQIAWSQNQDYVRLSGINGYPESYYDRIDIVQKYGNSPYFAFSWGDSEIRYTWHTLTLGFGTQSPWLGPAWLNPMLGSNNADPYPKIDIGLRKTAITIPFVNWYAGDIEARIWLGKLKQSSYFIGGKPDDRMLVAGSFSVSPSFINGLSVGFNRIFMTYWDWGNLSYVRRLFTTSHDNATGSGNDEDQKIALFADWKFPYVGFEVYGEYGFDDFSMHKIPDLFHTGIYTLGVKQITPFTDSIYGILNAEWNSSEISSDFYFQWNYLGYYAHSFVAQGYTNNGQIVGAGTGYFGNSQKLSYSLYYPKGVSTIFLHRYCNDNNHILNYAVHGSVHGSLAGDVPAISQYYGKYPTVLDYGCSTTFYLTDSLSVTAGADFLDVFMWTYDRNKGLYAFSANCSVKYTF